MHKEFVKYDQAVALKELGFDIPVNASWIINKMYPQGIIGFGSWQNSNSSDNHLSAPLKQQVFRWFREKHDLHHEIEFNEDEYLAYVNGLTANIFKTYEEAESACIDKLILILKENGNI